MRADWTASGECTSGSTAHPRGATRQASGGAATTSTTSAEPSRGCLSLAQLGGTGDLTTHGFRASFPASLLRRLGATLRRRQCGGDDRLVRVHVGDGRDVDALTDAARRRGVVALHVWVVMMMVAMMPPPPSLMPMLWRYSARPYDRTGKNPEVLIGFFAKNAISRLQKVLSAKI